MYTNNIKNVKVEDVDMEGARNAKIQWLITKDHGAQNFAMRRFILEKDAVIPKHQHPWEHEIFVLSGSGIVGAGNEEKELGPGDFAFIPPDVPHWYRKTSKDDWIFICIIPYKK